MKWKLVPVEPTEEMIKAGDLSDTFAHDAYVDMLAAAPSPPDELVEQVALCIAREQICGLEINLNEDGRIRILCDDRRAGLDWCNSCECRDSARAIIAMLGGKL